MPLFNENKLLNTTPASVMLPHHVIWPLVLDLRTNVFNFKQASSWISVMWVNDNLTEGRLHLSCCHSPHQAWAGQISLIYLSMLLSGLRGCSGGFCYNSDNLFLFLWFFVSFVSSDMSGECFTVVENLLLLQWYLVAVHFTAVNMAFVTCVTTCSHFSYILLFRASTS